LEPPEVAIVEQPTDHALWNLARALCVELMAGREYEPRVWRVTRVALVAGLAIINATGVYAQLVAAHVESAARLRQ